MSSKAQKKGFSHESPKSESVEWYTPPHIFESLDIKFDLDPCHPVAGIPWIPVWLTYTEIDDGLKTPWFGKVWLNPPYGKHTYSWLEKMHQHRNGVALVFARTDCKWYHDFVAKADAILFLAGRIRFVDGFGVTEGTGAGSGSMLIAWGVEAVSALKGMANKGHLVIGGKQ